MRADGKSFTGASPRCTLRRARDKISFSRIARNALKDLPRNFRSFRAFGEYLYLRFKTGSPPRVTPGYFWTRNSAAAAEIYFIPRARARKNSSV